MTKKRILFLFIFAGLILALAAGVYVYRMNRPPGPDEVDELLRTFISRIAANDLQGARELMTPDTAQLLRDPGTELGKTIYRNLSTLSVDHVLVTGDKTLSADVILRMPDTLSIMAKAGQLFAERVTETGPVEDTDAAMAEIYSEILARDDLPMISQFLIVRMSYADGSLRIIGDPVLQSALEGNSTENLNSINQIFGS